MINIYVKDVQAIKEFTFELPDNGIVQFFGDNSNGKSILGKILSYTVLQRLVHDDQRLPMINDDADYALLAISYNNRQFMVKIDRDVDKCFYMLVRANGEKVVRKIGQDGIDEMLREFGFLVFNKRSVTLQVCETYGPMPFVNRTDIEDAEIVTSTITDPTAERFIEQYTMCFKEAQGMLRTYQAELARNKTQLENTHVKNTEGFLELSERLKRCYDINSIMVKTEPIDIPYVPAFSFDMPKAYRIGEFEVPYLITEVAWRINGFDDMLNELWKIERGVCPNCGKKFIDDSCCV